MASREQIQQFISGLSESDRLLVNELMWSDRPLFNEPIDPLQLHLPEHQAPTGLFELLRDYQSLGSVYTKRTIFITENESNPLKIEVEIRIKGPKQNRGTLNTYYYFGINSHDQIYGLSAEQDLPPEKRTHREHTEPIAPPDPSEVIEHIYEAVRIESTLKSRPF